MAELFLEGNVEKTAASYQFFSQPLEPNWFHELGTWHLLSSTIPSSARISHARQSPLG
jgi:hypothetical protein